MVYKFHLQSLQHDYKHSNGIHIYLTDKVVIKILGCGLFYNLEITFATVSQ